MKLIQYLRIYSVFIVLLFFCIVNAYAAEKKKESDIQKTNVPPILGEIIPDLARVAYSGGEKFFFDISWTGGIKIGELTLQLDAADVCDQCFTIDATISTSGGIIHYLYPVEDRHKTLVQGKDRLPFYSELWQSEGRNYRAHKIILFNQNNFIVTHKKDGDPVETYHLNGIFHNEFSAFFASRVMKLEKGKPILVPTFGDEKRNEVVVETDENEIIENTCLGDVKVLKVTPVLTFSGLYDKRGDTIIWLSDDECRVPVLIRSKIVIGSLTATLVKYQNPMCLRYNIEVEL